MFIGLYWDHWECTGIALRSVLEVPWEPWDLQWEHWELWGLYWGMHWSYTQSHIGGILGTLGINLWRAAA